MLGVFREGSSNGEKGRHIHVARFWGLRGAGGLQCRRSSVFRGELGVSEKRK